MTYICESNAENVDLVRERHILLKRFPYHRATHFFADDPITRSRATFVKLFVLYPVIRNTNINGTSSREIAERTRHLSLRSFRCGLDKWSRRAVPVHRIAYDRSYCGLLFTKCVLPNHISLAAVRAGSD
jgi:hypothetical protein